MFRSIAAGVLFCFVAWLVPIGAFVDISKERMVCGGQRAVCLCHISKNKQTAAGKLGLAKAGGVEKESGGSGSPGTQFLVSKRKPLPVLQFSFFLYSQEHSYSSVVLSPSEPVPKA